MTMQMGKKTEGTEGKEGRKVGKNDRRKAR